MIGPEGFDALYRRDADPFGVAERWYERRKQAVLLASLGREDYALAWDCAVGTGHLAQSLLDGRCARLLATDASPEAVRLVTTRLGDRDTARVAQNTLPDVPEAARKADLTVVAEVLYYLSDAARRETLARLAEQRGELVAVHWRHHPHDAHLSGALVTEELGAVLVAGGWDAHVHHDDADFVLASWTRTDDDT